MLTGRRAAAIVSSIAAVAIGLPAVATPASATSATGPAAPVAAAPVTAAPRGCDPATATGATLRGAAAVTVLGAWLPVVAARNAMPAAALATALSTDATLRLDPCGNLLYVDQPAPAGPLSPQAPSLAGRTAYAGVLDAHGDAFALSSRPGSHRTIYLDFTGATLTGTAWNTAYRLGATSVLPPYDSDGEPGAFSAAELDSIREVWLRVAEDYAPFDVNVTTQDPGEAAIGRSDGHDQVYGTRAVISSSASFAKACGCGGVAYLGAIGWTGLEHDYYQPALVMTANLRDGWAKAVAEAASHEVGHTFGLSHDGVVGGSAYYEGVAAWAPIMGVGYYRPLTQWSKGEYTGANNGQDDIAVIAQQAPIVADDHGGSAAAATPLTPGVPATGVVASAQDEDWFSFSVLGGQVTVTVSPALVGADLDVDLQVVAADGTRVATAAPIVPDPLGDAETATGLDASYTSSTLTAGTYFVRVAGARQGSPRAAGWSAYGSLGRYAITARGALVAPLSVTTTVLADGVTGQPYAARLSASGAQGRTRWSVPAGTLPRGLALDSSTGDVTGRPVVARTFSLPVTVVDAGGRATTRSIRLVVRAPIRVVTSGVVAARHGSTYEVRLVASGGAGRTYWHLRRGVLPRGMTLTTSGLLRGRPLRSGVYRFTVQVADTASGNARPGHMAQQSYRLVVR